MDDEVRRCAHVGCDVRIVAADGRPQRRYCTAAHRAAARQARRATRQAGKREPCSRVLLPGRDALGESLPWLREPEARVREPGTATTRPDTVAPTAADRAAVRPRRRRTLAMLGVAGVLAGGYAASASRPEPPSPVPVQAAPASESPDAWAQRATVALASVNRQLDTLTHAEEEWERQAERGRTGRPAPVGALEERRSVLRRQRATLQAQLEAYRSLRMTQQGLAVSERHLQAVEKALADAPPGRRSTEQVAALAALAEQHDLRLRHTETQRAELTSLQEGVATAVRTPLPDDEAATDEVSRNLRGAARTGGNAPEPRDAHELRPPEVVAGRQQEDGKPREEAGVSGPPDPRGPRGEGEERRKATQRPVEEDVGEKDAARGTLDQLRARMAQAAEEARRAQVERKAAAEHSAHRDADEPAGAGVHEKTGERLEDAGHRKKEDAHTDEVGRTGWRKSDRADEADDDRIEERNAARAAEQAESEARRGVGGGTYAQHRPTDEDRSSDRKDSLENERSSEKERSSGKKRSAEKKSDRECSSRTEDSSDEERSSHAERTPDEERSRKSHVDAARAGARSS